MVVGIVVGEGAGEVMGVGVVVGEVRSGSGRDKEW